MVVSSARKFPAWFTLLTFSSISCLKCPLLQTPLWLRQNRAPYSKESYLLPAISYASACDLQNYDFAVMLDTKYHQLTVHPRDRTPILRTLSFWSIRGSCPFNLLLTTSPSLPSRRACCQLTLIVTKEHPCLADLKANERHVYKAWKRVETISHK